MNKFIILTIIFLLAGCEEYKSMFYNEMIENYELVNDDIFIIREYNYFTETLLSVPDRYKITRYSKKEPNNEPDITTY